MYKVHQIKYLPLKKSIILDYTLNNENPLLLTFAGFNGGTTFG